jgi:hypothetical protein
MSVISDVDGAMFGAVNTKAQEAEVQRSFRMTDTYWGYIIKARATPPYALVAGQVMAWFVGILLAVGGAGVWVLPMTSAALELLPLRVAVSTIFFAFAAILMWFASRGTEAELQVDTAQGELREVVRNRAGKPTLIGRYGFDSIGGVHFERGTDGQCMLVVRYQNTAQVLPVAQGTEAMLAPLRDRLGRDMMVRLRTSAEARAAA